MTNLTAEEHLTQVRDAIDSVFGKGHARQHPELVVAYLSTDNVLKDGIHRLMRATTMILKQQSAIIDRLLQLEAQGAAAPVASDPDQLTLPTMMLVKEGPMSRSDMRGSRLKV